jgi:hypothetical protein
LFWCDMVRDMTEEAIGQFILCIPRRRVHGSTNAHNTVIL